MLRHRIASFDWDVWNGMHGPASKATLDRVPFIPGLRRVISPAIAEFIENPVGSLAASLES